MRNKKERERPQFSGHLLIRRGVLVYYAIYSLDARGITEP